LFRNSSLSVSSCVGGGTGGGVREPPSNDPRLTNRPCPSRSALGRGCGRPQRASRSSLRLRCLSALEEHDAFIRHIEEHGHREKFEGRSYTYLDVDGFTYWASRCVYEPRHPVINRRPADADA
jgi:hypothetical protein